MSFLCRCRHSLIRASRPLIPRGTRGVTGQFDHIPVPLPYNIKHGLGKFLPPPALEAVAMEYQLGLLARLTEEVRETENEGEAITQVIINTAPYREKTLAFNYASLALNNSFFLGQLTPDPADSQEHAISTALSEMIRVDHGGLEQLKSSFSAAAMGMFTSGWIWFVSDKEGRTSILPTFGPGTLLVRSRTYAGHIHPDLYHPIPSDPLAWDPEMQYIGKYLASWGTDGRGTVIPELDPKQLSRLFSSDSTDPPPPPPRVSTGGSDPLRRQFHTSARRSVEAGTWDSTPTSIHGQSRLNSKTEALNAGDTLFPLFCISVQEHAWITAGYGVWGKEAWLREFWNVLNWRQVSRGYQNIANIANTEKK
ncbi:manganese superoxide dismutase [Mycena maculata]|uniref:Manganese superoxide dismutase n=1 Tax=Mycena maculata TaxID=230809 RepID=A0AAD7J2U8_9AGAR|nr:manganese superoxide dismutase [Mycena maculata]